MSKMSEKDIEVRNDLPPAGDENLPSAREIISLIQRQQAHFRRAALKEDRECTRLFGMSVAEKAAMHKGQAVAHLLGRITAHKMGIRDINDE